MDKLKTFTSTGIKLIHHNHWLKDAMQGLLYPISLQVAPTSLCNLNCEFCSNTNREKDEQLSLYELGLVIQRLSKLGLKTVEWTGGGDPTMWGQINEAIDYCNYLGLQQGLITNGILAKKKLWEKTFTKLKWIRISMNALDYVKKIDLDFPSFSGTLGFSYVWNKRTSDSTIDRLRKYAEKYNPAYIRVVPDCQATEEEQRRNNVVLGELVPKYGGRFFFQPKTFSDPTHCWWAYVKPFILHDGWVFPCSSVVLNTTSDYTFHKKFRWVKMEDLPNQYGKKATPLSTSSCDHCVFEDQNDMVEALINPNGMENFV